MKFNKDKRIEAINLYDKGYSYKRISKELQICTTQIKEFLKSYKIHGFNAIEHKHKSHPIEVKKSIIDRYYAGESQTSLAIELNCRTCVVNQWIKKYEKIGYNGLIDNRGRPGISSMSKIKKKIEPLTDPERKELNELRTKVRRLQMEIDCTKKLNALVQERIEREQKKK